MSVSSGADRYSSSSSRSGVAAGAGAAAAFLRSSPRWSSDHDQMEWFRYEQAAAQLYDVASPLDCTFAGVDAYQLQPDDMHPGVRERTRTRNLNVHAVTNRC